MLPTGISQRPSSLHDECPQALKELALIFRGETRRADIIGRWGGEEFLLIMPNTDLEQALMACERIRDHVDQRRFRGIGHVTISAGLAQAAKGESSKALIDRADSALYRAKNSGRNRSEVDTTAIPTPSGD